MALYSGTDNKDNNNKGFQFMSCWNLLRTQPKWHDKLKQLSSQKAGPNKKQKVTTEACPDTATPTNDDTANHDVRENETTENEVPKRPIRKKRAKEQLRRGGGDACVEALDHLWGKKESDAEKEKRKEERYKQSYALDIERLELEQKRVASELVRAQTEQARVANEANELQLKRMLEEERIMTVDITSMSLFQHSTTRAYRMRWLQSTRNGCVAKPDFKEGEGRSWLVSSDDL